MKLREDRWWNFPLAFALLAALLITSFKIESTAWTDNLYTLKWLTLIGFLLGSAFGYSYFSESKTRFFLLIYSIIILPWSFALQYGDELTWLQRLSNVSGRFGISLGQFFNNIRVDDPILFLAFLSLVIWISAVWAGYLMTRTGKPWSPLVISAITIFTTEFYYINQKNLYSAAFVIFSLFVISQAHFMGSTKKWHKKGTLIEFETSYHIARSAIIAGIILVLLSWNITGFVSAFQQTASQRSQISGIFNSIRNQFIKITSPLQGPIILQQEFYGDSVGLGTGAELSDGTVFEVQVDQFKPLGSRYYWRARTYDLFDQDYRWKNSITNKVDLVANSQPIAYPDTLTYPQRKFTFNSKINLGLLYTPAYPLNVNRSVTAIAEPLPDEKLDTIAVLVNRPIFAGEAYQVSASIPVPTIAEMREAQNDYPDWVSKYYLQLPDNFPERIRLLAENITQNENTSYDKVEAITRFLRSEIVYQEQIPEPPKDANPIEWFLFDLKAGFCNYYASAEVLMLRSIGIPARIVFGYAQGEASENQQLFLVTSKQSHAWPEVFFPGIGWVEIEPTASQPVITRLTGQAIDNLNGEGGIFERPDSGLDRPLIEDPFLNQEGEPYRDIELPANSNTASFIQRILPLLIIILFADLFALIAIRNKRLGRKFLPPVAVDEFVRKRGWKSPVWLKRWSYYVQLSAVNKAFASIAWAYLILNQPLRTAATPAEMVADFSILVPELSETADLLLAEYHKEIYSQRHPDLPLMQSLSRQIFIKTIQFRLRKIFITEDTLEYDRTQ